MTVTAILVALGGFLAVTLAAFALYCWVIGPAEVPHLIDEMEPPPKEEQTHNKTDGSGTRDDET